MEFLCLSRNRISLMGAMTLLAVCTAAHAAPPTTQWSFIANEGGSFTTSERQTVRYGTDGRWTQKDVTGTFNCTNAAFGNDPNVGVGKRCELGWSKVADEAQAIALPNTRRVRYGTDTRWVQRTGIKTGSCTNEFFGSDPAFGIGKSCQVAMRSTAPTAKVIEFRNLMVIYRGARRDGQSWTFSESAINATRNAFLNTWPALVDELSSGRVRMVNTVVVSNTTITGFDTPNYPTLPRTDGIGDWQSIVGETGRYDVMFTANPAPQDAMYALGGGVCCDRSLKVGWTFVPNRTDLGKYEDALAGWTHEWLHVMAESFYSDRLNVSNIPGVHDAGTLGYDRDSGNYENWDQWYSDFLRREIKIGDQKWGLGEPAWSKGTLRDYLRNGGN
jgi:hypothetical protein